MNKDGQPGLSVADSEESKPTWMPGEGAWAGNHATSTSV